ncbi:MAG: putative manganese-dependent inorganic diphosphatase [Candidatus Methylacidiphilales bacterium]|nr:putative manganese-dependent inorganic diphosphatase [Candidatus Methylacidiphilales bacterium]
MPTYVIGHRNPDTDAICSAIAYADLLRRTDRPDAVAARCGELNQRTNFALGEAGLDHPVMLTDVRPTAGMICQRGVETARCHETLMVVFNRMRDRSFRSLPVIDERGALAGMVSINKLVEELLPRSEKLDDSRMVETNLLRIKEVMDAKVLHMVDEFTEQPFLLTVGALSAANFRSRLSNYPAKQLLVVAGDRPTVQKPSIEYGVRCLIVTGGHELSPELLAVAKEKGVSVMTSPHDTATTTFLIKCSKSISTALETDVQTYTEDTLVKQILLDLQTSGQPSFPVIGADGAMIGIFSKTDLLNPPPIRVVMVDHNEFAQAVSGIEDAEIVEVIDHHRIGGSLITDEPVRFLNEPVGSTCTIVAGLYRARGIEPTPGMALCMASGIISDTIFLSGPTTTQTDKDIVAWLQTFCKRDLKDYAKSFFEAGSSLQVLTPEQVVTSDCKQYETHGWEIAVAQVEELGFTHFWERRDALAHALREQAANTRRDFACLLITDITEHDSYLLAIGNEKLLDAIDYPREAPDLFKLDGVVSRKKQLLPMLMRIASKIEKTA